MADWVGIKYGINSTLGTNKFKPLNEIVNTDPDYPLNVFYISNEIVNQISADSVDMALRSYEIGLAFERILGKDPAYDWKALKRFENLTAPMARALSINQTITNGIAGSTWATTIYNALRGRYAFETGNLTRLRAQHFQSAFDPRSGIIATVYASSEALGAIGTLYLDQVNLETGTVTAIKSQSLSALAIGAGYLTGLAVTSDEGTGSVYIAVATYSAHSIWKYSGGVFTDISSQFSPRPNGNSPFLKFSPDGKFLLMLISSAARLYFRNGDAFTQVGPNMSFSGTAAQCDFSSIDPIFVITANANAGVQNLFFFSYSQSGYTQIPFSGFTATGVGQKNVLLAKSARTLVLVSSIYDYVYNGSSLVFTRVTSSTAINPVTTTSNSLMYMALSDDGNTLLVSQRSSPANSLFVFHRYNNVFMQAVVTGPADLFSIFLTSNKKFLVSSATDRIRVKQ